MMEAFRKAGLMPSIIEKLPLAQAKVVYGSGSSTGHGITPGEIMTPTQVQRKPDVTWDAEEGSLYTLVMPDPDAPAPISQFLHWLVINIPGSDVSKGDERVEFVGSGPPKGSGFHRYSFFVFKQKGKIEVTNIHHIPKTTAEGRRQFKVQDFAQKHDLGVAVAGNFYNAEYDDYVPTVHKQLAGQALSKTTSTKT